MTNLRRVSQGKFKIDDSVKLDNLSLNNLIKIQDVLDVKKIELTKDIEKNVLNGAVIDNIYDASEILFMKNDIEVALYKKDEKNNKLMKIDKMF